MKSFQNIPAGVTYLLVMILTSCHGSSSEGADEDGTGGDAGSGVVVITREQFAESDMAIGRPDTVRFVQEIRGSGYVRASVTGKADAGVLLPGRITGIVKGVGDHVRRGELICTIEGNEIVELQQDYAEAVQELKVLEGEYLRQQALYKEQIASEKSYLAAKSGYTSMLARVSGLKAKLQMNGIDPGEAENGNIRRSIGIRAPIDGILISQPVYSGVIVEPGTTVAKIVNPAGFQLELNLFQKDVSAVEAGQHVTFRPPEQPGHELRAIITHTGRSVEEETHTIRCRAKILETCGYNLVEGMYVEYSIITCERTAPAIPVHAAVEEENRYYVMRKTGETESEYHFTKTPIKQGVVQDGYIEVLDEDPGEILISGSYLVIGAG